MRIHLDTDLGGDADDLCALAMLLGDPEVELAGITTSADATGQKAAFVRHALALAGRSEIPVAAGAASFLGGQPHELVNHDARYFPDFDFSTPTPRDPPGAALDLLGRSVESGAAVIAIGPYTNIAAFEAIRPGELASIRLTVMGGWLGPFPLGYPQWGPDMDYNVQADRLAARIVFERLEPLVVPLVTCLDTTLRRRDLPALRDGGPLSRLIALQGEQHATDHDVARLARGNPALPPDMLNFHWDPLACAAALLWPEIDTTPMRLALIERDGQLAFEQSPEGKWLRVATAVDVEGFRAAWLERAMRV